MPLCDGYEFIHPLVDSIGLLRRVLVVGFGDVVIDFPEHIQKHRTNFVLFHYLNLQYLRLLGKQEFQFRVYL